MTRAVSRTFDESTALWGRVRGLWAAYQVLTKARLSALVVLTAAVGYVAGAGYAMSWWGLVATSIGVALAAACANVFNQVMEVHLDRLMPRTAGRPLPAGALTRRHAVVLGAICGVAGVGLLAASSNWLATGMTVGTILLYTLAYTPLKTRCACNTLVGAVVGALPPMIGWAAAAGELHAGAWVLGLLLFFWQIPHFLALAWLYRDQYEAGGFKMLPHVDPTGRMTGRAVLLNSLALLAISLLLTLTGVAGFVYAGGALLVGVAMAGLAWRLYREMTDRRARQVFVASIVYLTVVMMLVVVDMR